MQPITCHQTAAAYDMQQISDLLG